MWPCNMELIHRRAKGSAVYSILRQAYHWQWAASDQFKVYRRECGRSVNGKHGHIACSQTLGYPIQHGGNAMAVYLENNYYCRKGSVTRVQCRVKQALLICAWAAWRRDYHKYAHANVSAASPLLNRHIDAHHPQQWVTLKARTHRPTVSKDYRAKLPLSSPQDVQRTPALGLALPAHQERP